MIIKRNFNPIKVAGYVKTEVTFAILATVMVAAMHRFGVSRLSIPFSISAILGSALAIFIAFRNNTAYSRWWEARTMWGGIINSSRVFARLIITFADSHAHQPNYVRERSEDFKRTLVNMTIAWAHALRMHLRKQDEWDTLKEYLTENDYKAVLAADNKPNYLHLLAGRKIYEAMTNGTLAGFDSFQLEGQLLALDNYQGGCERIKNTPLLRQYDFFTRTFLYTFMLLLPFSLIGDFIKMNNELLMIPVSIVISTVFAIIGKVGEVNEDPFENRITDVPLTAICNTIERDLKQMTGDTVPKKTEPIEGYLY